MGRILALPRLGGVVVQSYMVRGVTPRMVLEFYDRALTSGWEQVMPLANIGSEETASYRASWRRDGHELTVSSSKAPGLGGDAPTPQTTTQYSLTLRPLEGG